LVNHLVSYLLNNLVTLSAVKWKEILNEHFDGEPLKVVLLGAIKGLNEFAKVERFRDRSLPSSRAG
jgi:hypothetical protein